MHFKVPSLLTTLSLLINHSHCQTASETGEFVEGSPICALGGFTQVPGNYTQTTHQQTGATFISCFTECQQANLACQSIAFHARYTLCLWYDQVVEKTQLVFDRDSEFLHWDLGCEVTASGYGIGRAKGEGELVNVV